MQRSRTMKTTSLPLTLSAAVLLLAGCRVGPKYTKPAALATPPPAAYKEASTPPEDPGQWKPAQPQDAMLRGKWWEIYKDSELNDLEDKLNINNQNIKQFFENYMESRTLIAEARSQLYPTLSIGPGFSRSRSGTSGGAGSTSSGAQSSSWSMPLQASWEPDLFGRVRNQIREAQYGAQVSAADLENERLSEQATLATTFFEIRGQDALIEVLNNTVASYQKALDLTRNQYETGVGTQIAVVQALNTLQNAQAEATGLRVARAQYEHAIAVLIGTNPSTFSIPAKSLNATPPPVPLGMPSQLLERRPDVAAAERQMAVVNSEIGIATAAYYPTLDLTAEAGFESSVISKLFNWPSRFWSVGSTASETIFDAGLRRATVRQYVATYNAQVATYRQTVLTAFQQVEDSVSTLRTTTTQIQQQQAAVSTAQQSVDLETARYETGIDPYIDVVQAQTTLLSDQSTVASLHTQAMVTSVQLIQALGGGWDTTDLPSPTQVTTKLSNTDITIEK